MNNIYNLNSNLKGYLISLKENNFDNFLLTLNIGKKRVNARFKITDLKLDNILINNSLNVKEFTTKEISNKITSFYISSYKKDKSISLFFDEDNNLYYIYLILSYNSFSLSSEKNIDNFSNKTSINDLSKANPFILEKEEFSTFEQLDKLKTNLVFL